MKKLAKIQHIMPKDININIKYTVIGKNIRAQRKIRRLSVDELAEHLGLSASYVGLLERGDRCPSLKVVYNLCVLFDISPNELLTSEQDDRINKQIDMRLEALTSLVKTLKKNEIEFVIETIKKVKDIYE